MLKYSYADMNFILRIIQSLFSNNASKKPRELDIQEYERVAEKVLSDFAEANFVTKSISSPIASGMRSSIDENAIKENFLAEITPEFEIRRLKQINTLAVHHPDFSKALQNVMDLGNTEQIITFDASVSERNARKMREHLRLREKTWYRNQTSVTFVNTLLIQLAKFGAISQEIVPKVNLKGIDYIVDVNNEHIRFFYEKGFYVPVQIVNIVPAGKQTYKGTPYNKLNPAQYKYIPLVKSNSSPYGIPPFIAALMSEDIQSDMMVNFKAIVRRLGAFGFLSVYLQRPEIEVLKRDDKGKTIALESPEQYKQRLIDLLNSQRAKVMEGFSTGVVLGFKGDTEFKIDGNSTNASNASDMFGLVDTSLAAGLKQDPSLLGRNRTVTETFGRVILQLLETQVQTMQQLVAEFLSHARLMELQMAGFKVNEVITTFAPPLKGDAIKAEQERQLRIANAEKLYLQGIISQTQFAQELGYDSPFLPAPLATNSVATSTTPVAGDSRTDPSATQNNGAATNLVANRNKLVATFDYALPKEYLSYEDSRTDWGDATMQKYADDYIGAIEEKYNKAAKKVSRQVGEALEALPAAATVEEWEQTAQGVLESEMQKEFASKIKKTCDATVKEMYEHYRKDKSIFPKQTKTENSNNFAAFPPEAKLDLADKRAIEWLQKHDNFYLSKFITDADTTARILAFINEFYLEQGETIGDNTRVLAEFIARFGDVLNGEIWKIRRVLDTSVNKIRSYANVAYMHQANVSDFKVVEVMDRITCAHCQNMNGRTFSVAVEKTKIENVTKNEPSEVGTISPFVTTIPIADLEKLNDQEIQAKGIGATPFHPSCRGTLVAVI